MGKDHLDDKIKSRLHSHEEFIDKNELWAAIQNDKKKRILPIFWWMFGLLGICLISVLFWNSILNTESAQTSNNKGVIIENKPNLKIDNSLAPLNKLDNTSENNEKQIETIKTIDANFTPSTQKNTKIYNSSAQIKNIKTSTSTIVQVSEIIKKEAPNNREIPKFLNEVNQNLLNSPKNLFNNINDLNENQKSTLIHSTQDFAEIEDSIIVNSIDLPTIKSKYNLIPINLKYIDITLTKYLEDKPKIQPIVKNKLSLDLSVGGGQSIRSFTFTEDSPYDDMRSSNESSLEFLNASIGLKYNFNKNWYGKMGFDYSRYTERLKFNAFSSNVVKEDSVPILIKFNLKGDSTITTSPGEGVQIVNEIWEYFNYYHTINIPIKVGYHIPINKFGLLVEAGPVINLGFFQDINVLDENGVVTYNPNTYKSNIGFGIEASIGVSYKINKSISLYATPSYRYNFSNALVSSRLGNHKLSSIYLRIGSYINI